MLSNHDMTNKKAASVGISLLVPFTFNWLYNMYWVWCFLVHAMICSLVIFFDKYYLQSWYISNCIIKLAQAFTWSWCSFIYLLNGHLHDHLKENNKKLWIFLWLYAWSSKMGTVYISCIKIQTYIYADGRVIDHDDDSKTTYSFSTWIYNFDHHASCPFYVQTPNQ